jgi:stearoyl-CoA desaturase (delta-9 desaturase)
MNLTTKKLLAFNIFYTGIGLIGLTVYASWWILLFWLFFAVGNGTIGHRYFAHNSFKTATWLHKLLTIWCTLSAYSPVNYWQVQHRHHHRHSDTEQDIHSPINGRFMSLFGWMYSQQRIESVFVDRASVINLARANQDSWVKFVSEKFILINLSCLILLLLIDPVLVFAAGAAFVIEQFRLGAINLICHWPRFPGNYRNHATRDHSYNNWILGPITLGFAWHNNHHADAQRLILTNRWWEIDIEGYIGWLFSLSTKIKFNRIAQ